METGPNNLIGIKLQWSLHVPYVYLAPKTPTKKILQTQTKRPPKVQWQKDAQCERHPTYLVNSKKSAFNI